MDLPTLAKALYRDGKSLLDTTRDLAVTNDLIRWTRDDLDEALLDLKLAVMEDNHDELDRGVRETVSLMYALKLLVGRPKGGER